MDLWVVIILGGIFLALVLVLIGMGVTTKAQHARDRRQAEAQQHINDEWKRLDDERKRRGVEPVRHDQDPPEDP
jgi:hypothetical protein